MGMTPLEKFNEEVNINLEVLIFNWKENSTLNYKDISNFITQKLTEHKELILKMIKEKAPNLIKELRKEGHIDPIYIVGFQDGISEILNNLDTI